MCGVGHEDDLTIADLVSDLRASTPSNAAELLVRDRDEMLFQVQHNIQTINNELERLLNEADGKIRKSVYSLGNAIGAQVSSVKSTISKFTSNFVLFKREIINLRRNMYTLVGRISKGSNIWFGQQQTKIENVVRLLNSFDVQKTMKRGFSITFDNKGNILKTIKHLGKGSHITTNLFDGKIGAQVLNINKK